MELPREGDAQKNIIPTAIHPLSFTITGGAGWSELQEIEDIFVGCEAASNDRRQSGDCIIVANNCDIDKCNLY